MRHALALLPLVLTACGGSPSPAPSAQPNTAPDPPAPASSASAAPAGDRTLRFVVDAMGHATGSSVVTIHANGSRDATWEFNDRGRGPKQDTHWETAPDGTLARVDITGVDYLKQPVDEHLHVDGGRLVWSNNAEHGDAPAGGHAYYVPIEGAPDLTGTFVRAMLAAPDGRIALLPGGSAHVTRADDATVAADGKSMHVVRYEIDGVAFEPFSVWLDDDRELFASASPWFSVVREGWQSVLPKLNDVQREASVARYATLAKKLAHTPPAAGLAIVHARLFDSEKKRVVPDATIVMRGDRIVAAGPGATTKVPAGAETIDAAGKTALPGLWDMHAHFQRIDGLLDVANGVTGGRDLGNDMEELRSMKQAWDAGTEIGPHVLMAGLIDGRGPFQGPSKVFADTVDEGKSDIDVYAGRGYEQIKLYSSLKPELVAPLAAYAHSKGLRVSGHIPAHMFAAEAVDAGYDEIQHANFLMLQFLASRDDDTRTPLRFTLVAQKGAALDLASADVRKFAALLVKHKTVIDPTLATFEPMFLNRPGQIGPTYAAVADRIPVQVRRGLLQGGLPVPEGMDATYRASYETMKKLVKRLWDAGVRVVAGTDDIAGFTLHRELELYVDAGIPAPDVLALATIGAARVMKHEKDAGSIAPGKYADVVLVDGKPDEHISDVRKPVTVVKGGTVYASADLLAAVGVRP
ncbi:MAG TPA: amidohydrolase family protein [Polyangiaceae bacterium]